MRSVSRSPSNSFLRQRQIYQVDAGGGLWPVSQARPPSSRTRRSPPGRRTGHPRPRRACAAAATATALVPDALVSPTPRSQTRTVRRSGARRRATTWTFVRFGEAHVRLEQRPEPRDVLPGRRRRPRAGCRPTHGPRSSPSIRSGSPTSTSPTSCSTRPSPSIRATMSARARRGSSRPRRAGALREPAGGDARAVPRELGDRAVGVPDPRSRRGRSVVAEHLEHAVGCRRRELARPLGRQRLTLVDEVGRSRARPRSRISSATSPARAGPRRS